MDAGSFFLSGFSHVLEINKSLLLLLPLAYELVVTDEFINKRIDEYTNLIKNNKFSTEHKAFITWVINDNFDEYTAKRKKKINHFALLEKIKEEILDLYTNELNKETHDSQLKITGDIYIKLEKYIIKLMRMREVIQPEIQISRNVHPVTNIPYLAAKAFWIEDTGEKKRRFTKSLGREDEYALGSKDPKVKETAISKIQEVMFQSFKEAYPE